ncbi:hypothetical protein LCGC14_2580720, partial [marine sediment metagenome]
MANELTTNELLSKVVDAIELNTEKLQEVLERIECIDNTLDDFKDQRGIKEQSDADFRENVLEWLRRIHQQGTP